MTGHSASGLGLFSDACISAGALGAGLHLGLSMTTFPAEKYLIEHPPEFQGYELLGVVGLMVANYSLLSCATKHLVPSIVVGLCVAGWIGYFRETIYGGNCVTAMVMFVLASAMAHMTNISSTAMLGLVLVIFARGGSLVSGNTRYLSEKPDGGRSTVVGCVSVCGGGVVWLHRCRVDCGGVLAAYEEARQLFVRFH